LNKVPRTEFGKFSHFFPCQATIVTSHHEGQDNAMAVAWHMPISAEPALYGVGISPDKLSHKMITASRQFGVNFMPFKSLELVAATGGPSGKSIDKLKAYNIKKGKPVKTSVPILTEAYASFECVLEDEMVYGDHSLFVGRVVVVHQLTEAFDEANALNVYLETPVFYMGKDRYLEIKEFNIRHMDRNATANQLIRKYQS